MQHKVKALNIGLGSNKGSLKFTQSLDAWNHVATENETNTVEVDVNTLDAILSTEDVPALIKIDVEGFETEVLNGAARTLAEKKLKAIIIELNGLGKRYGYDQNQIHKKLVDYGFKPFNYDPKFRQLKELETFGLHNTIYLRDTEFVSNRIKSSRQVKVGSNLHAI
jgi:hypothetical protein